MGLNVEDAIAEFHPAERRGGLRRHGADINRPQGPWEPVPREPVPRPP